ncbi:MAG: hypothetical protein COT09_01690, partial [Candidatus Hydromicrobium americanum]
GKIESDEVKFLFKDPNSAAIITSADSSESEKQEEETTYLLMPIRLE